MSGAVVNSRRASRMKIKGVKVHLGVEKHGIPLAIDVSPANTHDGVLHGGGRGKGAPIPRC